MEGTASAAVFSFKGERLGEPSLCVPAAPGLQPLHESGKLEGMLAKAESKQKMLETHLF